ncbi:MAG: phosphate signaling complex protein PhoU [Candidatus Nanopelagicales bacterium]
MRKEYFQELESLRDQLVDMTELVRKAMSSATQALLEANIELADQVIENDTAIDSLNADVEDRALELITLQAPVATDLRVLISGMRIAQSLERMGDLAVHVARAARMRYPRTAVPPELRFTIEQMGAIAELISAKTAEVVKDGDVQGAFELAEIDDDMDELHRSLFIAILSPDRDVSIEAAIDVTLLSRYYERYADHAVTIGKRVVHIATGEPYAATSID